MTWTKLSSDFAGRPALLSVPRGARLLHVEALIWSNTHAQDGHIPGHVLTRITDELEPDKAAAGLVDAGVWEIADDGWQIVDSLDDQPSKADMDKVHELWRVRQRRQRQHRSGDHSLCDPRYCHVTRDSRVSHDTRTVPIRSDPSRKSEDKDRGAGDERSRLEGARFARAEGEQTSTRPSCPKCGKPWPHDRVAAGTIPNDEVCKECRPISPRSGWMAVERIAEEVHEPPEYVLDETGDEVSVVTKQGGLIFTAWAGEKDTGVWIDIEGDEKNSIWPANQPLPDERFRQRALEGDDVGSRRYTPADALAIAQHWIVQTKEPQP